MFFDATELQEVLGTVTCPHMKRAFRNRSPITVSLWNRAAFKLTGDHYNGGAIYAACSRYCSKMGVFDGGKMTPGNWQEIAGKLPGFIADPPELALSRYRYEVRHGLTDSRQDSDYPAGKFRLDFSPAHVYSLIDFSPAHVYSLIKLNLFPGREQTDKRIL